MATDAHYSIANTKDQYKKIFFQYGSHADQSTVAYSIICTRLLELEYNTKSGKYGHAEEKFITLAKVELRSIEWSIIKEVIIVMMISKSPCFNCREELEVFFEELTKKGAQIRFILRITNLYCGDESREEDKKLIRSTLAYWLKYLKDNDIVYQVEIEPIKVFDELTDYTPRNKVLGGVSWEKEKKSRRQKDTKIQYYVQLISEEMTQIPAEMTQNPAEMTQIPAEMTQIPAEMTQIPMNNIAPPQSYLAEYPKRKRIFYQSNPQQPPTQAITVTIGQLEVNAVNTMRRRKSKINTHVVSDAPGCCDATEKVWLEITSLPKCWNLTTISLKLTSTHCPCRRCLQYILNKLIKYNGVKIHLTLQFANFCDDTLTETDMAKWMIELEEKNIHVELESFEVIRNLQMYKPRDMNKEDWDEIKSNRCFNDLEIQAKVRDIYSEKQRIQNPPSDQDDNGLETQLGHLNIQQ